MKHIKRLGCLLLAGLLLCGVLAAALPREDTAVQQQASIPALALEPEKEQLYTMKVADRVQLQIIETTEPEQPEPDSGTPEETPGSAPDADLPEEPGSAPALPEETVSSWKSDDETVVTVEETGLVTAVGEGTTRVYRAVTQGIVSVTITVSGYAVTEVQLEAAGTMKVGETQTIQATILPEQAETTLRWSSDNPDVLAVSDDGTVTAVSTGKAAITAEAENGITASVEITVSEDVLRGISIQPASLSLKIGTSQAVSIVTDPAGMDPGKINWKSSDSSIAYYKNGKIHGAGAGNATITATTSDGKSASCKVRVTGGSLAVNPEALTLRVGAVQTIQAYVTPSGTPVTWTSGTPAVARVDQNGKVTAIKKGAALITAKAGGLTATCVVTVIQPTTPNSIRPSTPNTGSSSFVPFSGGGILYLPGSLISTDTFYTMPAKIPSAVYLTVDSDLSTATDSILSTLSSYHTAATFFVPINDLYASDDVLRHIAGSGNSIGFLLTAEQASAYNTIQMLNTANEQLSVITGTPTYLVRIAGGSSGNITPEQAAALIHAGYRLWDWNITARETALSAENAYASISRGINTTNAVTVRFGSNTNTAAVLQQLLPYMKYCGIPAYAISAGDLPVCNTAAG